MSIKKLIALAVTVGSMVLVFLAVNQVPNVYQYAAPLKWPKLEDNAGQSQQKSGEPKEEAESGEKKSPIKEHLKAWKNALENEKDTLKAALLTAYQPGASLSTKQGESTTAEAKALYGQLHTLPEQLLVAGRRLYQEDLDDGARVAVIDEGLAVALFRQGDAVGRSFEFAGHEYEVVGVARHTRQLGDRADYGFSIPLLSVADGTEFEIGVTSFLVKGGSGAKTAVLTVLKSWQSNGEEISLTKEKYRALLPVRWLLCAVAIAFVMRGFRYAGVWSRRMITYTKDRLESQYASRLWPLIAGVALAVIGLYALNTALLSLALHQAVVPVNVFTEWVPAILVEPKEIMKTFWLNITQVTALVSYRTPELLRLQAFRGIMSVAAIVTAYLLYGPWARLKKPE